MSEFNCVKCGGKLECFGGLSAHPDNWTCPKCDRAAMSNHITAFSHVTGVGPDRAAMSSDTPRTPVSVWVVCDGAGDCLFATNDEQNAKDHFQICVDEPSEFRTGPYTLTEYVPKRDLAARDAELAQARGRINTIGYIADKLNDELAELKNKMTNAAFNAGHLRSRAKLAEAELAQARLFIVETGYVLRHPMYADEENRDGLAEDCKWFATGEVCAKYLDVKHQTDRAIRAESELADWKSSGEKMAARFNEVVAERGSWKAKAEASARDAERKEGFLRTIEGLIADDAYAMGFQSLGQYRTALIGWFDEHDAAIDAAREKP